MARQNVSGTSSGDRKSCRRLTAVMTLTLIIGGGSNPEVRELEEFIDQVRRCRYILQRLKPEQRACTECVVKLWANAADEGVEWCGRTWTMKTPAEQRGSSMTGAAWVGTTGRRDVSYKVALPWSRRDSTSTKDSTNDWRTNHDTDRRSWSNFW